jgi:6-pyruvoyltetrahydropterin/6-carboxytetrahydropterin synthase
MQESYRVRLDKEYHVFSASHFITFDGDVCERIHGHNYRVAVEVGGPLDENSYVIDFIALRDALKAITDELDHHVLLPTEHEKIRVEAGGNEVRVVFEDRRWVFPRCDCVLLPLPNTTAELLARHIGRKLLGELNAKTGRPVESLRVEIDENNGQWAICELAPAAVKARVDPGGRCCP